MVQIYQNEELNDLMFEVEALDEWKSIADELGLEKQSAFVSKAESPIPYPFINNGMERIFQTLCPTKVGFKEYDKTPIPLEVLKQLQLSVRDKHFGKIEVWYDDKTPDPFAIGVTAQFSAINRSYDTMKGADGKPMLFNDKEQCKDYAGTVGFDFYRTNETNVRKYLIARWGDEIRPIAELKQLAKERLIETHAAALKNEIEERTNALKKINENAILYLNGEISESQLKGSRW